MIGVIVLMAIIGIILAWVNLPGTFLFLLLVFLFDFFLEKTFHYSLNLPENYLLWMLCIFTIAEIIEFVISRPDHVNLADVLILPQDQATSSIINKKSVSYTHLTLPTKA